MTNPLLTILTAPKPFTDPHIITIQTNALRSWKILGEKVEVFVMGDDPGIKEHSEKLGVRHFPDVACNEEGTPLISSMLAIGRENSSAPLIAIVNSDIILFPDFLRAVENVFADRSEFLLIGQRWDMDVENLVGDTAADFRQFEDEVKNKGQLHKPAGSDYFVFPRNCYSSIPDFAIGRAGWDNWFIYHSRWKGRDVIDGTHDITIVHQNHDYGHLPGGKAHYRLPETKRNVKIGGGEHKVFSLLDAPFELVDGKIRKKQLTFARFLRAVEIFPLTNQRSQFLGKIFFYAFHPRRAYRKIRKRLQKIIKN